MRIEIGDSGYSNPRTAIDSRAFVKFAAAFFDLGLYAKSAATFFVCPLNAVG